MYVVRVYKDFDTNKNLAAKIVNEETLTFEEVDWETLTKIIVRYPGLIKNVELDSNRKAKLKNMNPRQKIKYYNKAYVDNFVVNQYCIILGNRLGYMDFIADSVDGVHAGSHVIIGDIAKTLGVADISKLRLYNAIIDKYIDNYDVYLFTGSNYRKLQKINNTSDEDIKNIFGRDWEYDIDEITQDGIRLNTLEYIGKAYEAVIPDCVSRLDIFCGGVNALTIPMSVKELGTGCFEEIDDIYKVRLEDGITSIPKNCFRNSSLVTINLPNSIKEIDESAFDGSLLKGPVITTAIKIGRNAFSSTDIKSLITVNTVEIGICAFEFCYKLSKLKLDKSLKIIKPGAFRGCSSLTEVTIPSSVTSIGKCAFNDCSKLRLARVPVSADIGERAFPKKCQIVKY